MIKVNCSFEEAEDEEEVVMKTRQQQLLLESLSQPASSSNDTSTLSTDSGSSEATGGSARDSLKPTFSQATMNSHLLNALPKYIFQTDHAALKSVSTIIAEVKEKQSREDESLNRVNSEYELGEYPIELLENQQHAIERHMSIR
jgi:hypothetical protein